MHTAEQIYSVSLLNSKVNQLLDAALPSVWVKGEISTLAAPTSGHIYFTLIDHSAQLRCAMFRNSYRKINFTPQPGQSVLVFGQLNLYESRGDFQLIVEKMQPHGDGLLAQEFIALKAKLDKEGLFANECKQTIPSFPSTIGVITSPTGAAAKDIISVSKRRYPMAKIIIYPVSVQGATAARQIIDMLQCAQARAECDVLILARGGGATEDLAVFNHEELARQIAACQLPIITGIGHEIDFTIADFVADKRAATPSAAAEIACPDQTALLKRLRANIQSLQAYITQCISNISYQLLACQQRLPQPQLRLQQYQQRVDELELKLRSYIRHRHRQYTAIISNLYQRLRSMNQNELVRRYQATCASYEQQLQYNMHTLLTGYRHQYASLVYALDAISPLATLQRGYAIVKDSNATVIHDAESVNIGEPVNIQLARGQLYATVFKRRNNT